jgi:hypothetical protein
VPRTRRSSGDVLDVTERLRSIETAHNADFAAELDDAVVPATRSEQASRCDPVR